MLASKVLFSDIADLGWAGVRVVCPCENVAVPIQKQRVVSEAWLLVMGTRLTLPRELRTMAQRSLRPLVPWPLSGSQEAFPTPASWRWGLYSDVKTTTWQVVQTHCPYSPLMPSQSCVPKLTRNACKYCRSNNHLSLRIPFLWQFGWDGKIWSSSHNKSNPGEKWTEATLLCGPFPGYHHRCVWGRCNQTILRDFLLCL